MRSQKAATSLPGWGSSLSRYRPGTARSSARYPSAASEISETTGEGGRTVRVKLHDKLAALDKLAKVLSLHRKKVEVSGPNGGPIPMQDAKQRLAAMLGIGITVQSASLEIPPPARRIAAPVRQPAPIIDAD